mgnify:CR=1 FL=1
MAKMNLEALTEFKLSGRTVVKGQVVPKSDFKNTGDWQNLCHMTPARAIESDKPVGVPEEVIIPDPDDGTDDIPPMPEKVPSDKSAAKEAAKGSTKPAMPGATR